MTIVPLICSPGARTWASGSTLTPTSASGYTGYEVEGKVKGAGASTFEALGKFDPTSKAVRGNVEAGVVAGVGSFELTLQDSTARLTLEGEQAKGQVKLTRALAGVDDAALSEILFQLNKLNLLLETSG